MAYLIGTDEAGYGPNLGPLVIGASVWEVPDDLVDAELYELLAKFVGTAPTAGDELDRLAIADSKALYSPGGGLGQLERGVLSSLLVTKQRLDLPCEWREVCLALAPDCGDQLDAVPWYQGESDALPAGIELGQLQQLATNWQAALDAAGIRLVCLRAAACLPTEFNRAVAETGSKGTVLSRRTLSLVGQLMEPLPDTPILVHCDKHGGRNKYNNLLQEVFPDYLVEVRCEGRARSSYRWGPSERRVEASFVAKGEGFLPSALASMAAKYLRELSMAAFNRFWLEHVPGIKPTAGYPTDAKRFKQQISAAQKKLGITDQALWRVR